jgi:hypothetical protein
MVSRPVVKRVRLERFVRTPGKHSNAEASTAPKKAFKRAVTLGAYSSAERRADVTPACVTPQNELQYTLLAKQRASDSKKQRDANG